MADLFKGPLWTIPRYPGDCVRSQLLRRGDEMGEVCLQLYETFATACSLLPGSNVSSCGDTPKTWPEKSQTVHSSQAADEAFDRLLGEAYADGWQNYDPEGGVTIDWMTGRESDG
jgi:hypothetical protein